MINYQSLVFSVKNFFSLKACDFDLSPEANKARLFDLFFFSCGLVFICGVINMCLPSLARDWWQLVFQMMQIIAFIAIVLMGAYIALSARDALAEAATGEAEKSDPVALLPAHTRLQGLVEPYKLVLHLPNETRAAFSERALKALKEPGNALIIGYRDPLVVIKSANVQLRALRGQWPWENKDETKKDCFSEDRDNYLNYAEDFCKNLSKQIRFSIAESADMTLEDIFVPHCLPQKLPSAFVTRAINVFLVLLLSVAPAFGQSLEDILGKRAYEIPPAGSVVHYVTEKKTYVFSADGLLNYYELFVRNTSAFAKGKKRFIMVLKDGVLVAPAALVNSSPKATRVRNPAAVDAGPQPSSSPSPLERSGAPGGVIPPRPGSSPGFYFDEDAAKTAAQEFKEELETQGMAIFRFIDYLFSLFLLIFATLLICARMVATMAINEMIITYYNKILFGNFLMKAVSFLSSWQLIIAWGFAVFLLIKFEMFLVKTVDSVLINILLLFGFSWVLVLLSKYIVVSPRDLVEGDNNQRYLPNR